MPEKQIKEFIAIFNLAPDHYNKVTTINKEKFIEYTTLCDLNFKLYEVSKYAIVGMVGLKPQDIEEEREAILAVLDQNRNIEAAIHSELEKFETFYVMEREFWDSWTDNVSFKGNQSSFATRKQKKQIIDNDNLIEEGH